MSSRCFRIAMLLTAFWTFGLGAGRPSEAAGSAPAASESVSGQVKDSSGGVVVGASVTLRSTSGDWRREASTDAEGRFHFASVPAGAYVVVAFRDGFAPATREVSIAADKAADLELVLSPANFSEEVSVSFKGAHSYSALKADTPVKDIPLSVQSYTSSFMKAIETTNVADLYSYTLGVSRSGNTATDFSIRGVANQGTAGNMQYNGLPGLAARWGSPSTENIERIEILKGPSSILYGQAKPGGIINIVTKKPQAERSHLVDIRGGTFFGTGPGFGDSNKYHLAADFTGPVDRNRKLLYRLVTVYDHDETFRDFATNRDLYIVPAVSWLGWGSTIVNVELEYRRTRNGLDNGLVPPNNDITLVAPITVRYQEPGDYLNEKGKTASFSVDKLFANGLDWTINWRSVWEDDDTKGYENTGSSGLTLVTRRDRRQINTRRYHFIDTTLRRKATTGIVHHGLLFGLNGGYELQENDRLQFRASTTLNVDVYHPTYGLPNPATTPDTHRHTDFKNYGAYIQDKIDLAQRWKGLAGLRWDRQDSTQEELRINPKVSDKANHAFSPVAGLVFQPDHVWSLYGSFSTSFTPAAAGLADAKGENPFKPERGRQFEVGAKADLGDGRGEATLALFDLTRDDVLILLVGAINDQIGQEKSRGLELSVSHRILDNWQMIAGYAYTDSTVTKDADPRRIGAQNINAPKHAANLWSRYDVPRGGLHGLGFGLGLVYSSDRAASIPSSTSRLPVLHLPSYFRVDTGLYYVARQYELTAKIVNLTDEIYYEGALNTSSVRPGSPRAATLSVRVKF